MRVYFGTVNRSAPVRAGGELVCLNWDSKRILHRVPVFPDNPSLDHDPNPRGNTRGCRGIFASRGEVLAASYHTLDVFDPDLGRRRSISHGTMVGLHEICPVEDHHLWLASTAIDAAIKLDLRSGRIVQEYWPREMPEFQRLFHLEPLPVDKAADNRARYLGESHVRHPSHLHLNAICEWQGETYALFHAFGAICNLSKGSVLVRDPALVHGHNLELLEDATVLSNDTFGHSIRRYDLRTGRLLQVIDLAEFRWVRSLRRGAVLRSMGKSARAALRLKRASLARPLFLRGLDVCDGHLFAGLSPASILCISLRTGELVDAYQFSGDVNACIHGLSVVA